MSALFFSNKVVLDVLLTISGRFVSPGMAKKYDLELLAYEGIDQVVEVDSAGHKL